MTTADLRGDWSFLALESRRHDVEGFDVLAANLPHKSGRTYGLPVMAAAGAWPTRGHGPLGCGTDPAGRPVFISAAAKPVAVIE
jgi:hypothetical protein